MAQTLYRTTTPTIKAETYKTIQANAQDVILDYWFHTVEANAVTIARKDGTKHTLSICPAETSCDCKGFTYRGYCCHVAAFPTMHRTFSAFLNTEIETAEKREMELLLMDVDNKTNPEQKAELGLLQIRLESMVTLATKCDTISQCFRVQAMAGKAKVA